MTTLVTLSGGMDSTTALALTLMSTPREQVRTVGFYYGQRHATELEHARRIAEHYSVPFDIIDLSGLLSGSSLVDHTIAVPDGHYEDESMKATVVHGRNMLFASAAVSRLEGAGDVLVLGVHAGDHHIYPDCRPTFWQPYAHAVQAAYGVVVATPFLFESKTRIAAIGAELGAPLHLTWSCYKGSGEAHCGTCGTCVERREAFTEAGLEDPTRYETAGV